MQHDGDVIAADCAFDKRVRHQRASRTNRRTELSSKIVDSKPSESPWGIVPFAWRMAGSNFPAGTDVVNPLHFRTTLPNLGHLDNVFALQY